MFLLQLFIQNLRGADMQNGTTDHDGIKTNYND
jgi:hypothetical protein